MVIGANFVRCFLFNVVAHSKEGFRPIFLHPYSITRSIPSNIKLPHLHPFPLIQSKSSYLLMHNKYIQDQIDVLIFP